MQRLRLVRVLRSEKGRPVREAGETSSEARLFLVAFELTEARRRDYERVYAQVHLDGGWHYRQEAGGTWGRLPAGVVVARLSAHTPELARIAFELKLARLDLFAATICVTEGEPICELAPVRPAGVPAYARGEVQLTLRHPDIVAV